MRGSCDESVVTFDSIRLEMSSSLEQDYDEFKFSRENELAATDVDDKLENFSDSLDTKELESCEICEQKFQAKKDLQTHVLIHLGKPRVVLKRIANVKTPPKKPSDHYWLGGNEQRRGNLKITLKKNHTSCESLKLKLKKSPESESFTVVSRNFDLDSQPGYDGLDELAEAQDNETKSDSDKEESTDQDFENVMLSQENNYSDDNFESEPSDNPLENSERPSMDNNEGDSGVGSDFVNPLDKEDQNDNDSQADNASNQDPADVPDNEDNEEESDALEACRETIENLKKLGEQSSSRSSELLEDPSDVPAEEDEDKEMAEEEREVAEEEEEEDADNDPTSAIEGLRGNREISIVPKSALMPDRSANLSPGGAETEIVPISWNKITTTAEDSRSRSRESSHDKDAAESSENTGSLLQSFLIEQQRNQNNDSSTVQSFETEYVSLERLADTVNTCRVCNEKFKDIAHLDAHRSKAGHYQCNVPDCSALVFTTPVEVSLHKAQAHGAPISPRLANAASPHMVANRTSPHVNAHSPHSPAIARNSPITSPHANSPTTYPPQPATYPPVNLEQLPAPVQQLAQQVQRMPLPQPQMPGVMPPGANTMIPGPNYFPQHPGRPPMYRVQPPTMQYPPHLAHLYQQYNPHYQQMGMPQQMQPQQMQPQQMPRGRYPAMVPGQRAPRMSQPPIQPPIPRQRMKRPMPPQQMPPQSQPTPAKRRMDVLLPDRNEDAECHVIAQQKRNDGMPVIQNVQGGTLVQPTNRSDSTIHLTDSITLSVRQPAQVNAMVQSAKKTDATAVANVLAARGITVTPANNKKPQEQVSQQQQQQQQPQQQRQQEKQPLNVTALNLNSAISIIPASSVQRKQQDQQQAQFAVPQNKQAKQVSNEVERPPRPPTVDLTQDAPSLPVVRRGRPPRMLQSLTCNVCDKRFQSQEILSQHMATHRTTNKLLHKCNLCPAQYPTASALATHKKTYHKEVDATPHHPDNIELALPVVDLKSQNTLNRLASLGIQSYIPLSQLSAQTGGYFGLPIITVDGARNSSTCNLGALGATSILSLGPLKHLSNR